MDTNLTSIRIPSDVYEKIEALADRHSYWKKSTIINGLLAAVLYNFKDEEIYDMIREWAWNRNEVDCKFEIIPEICPPKRK